MTGRIHSRTASRPLKRPVVVFGVDDVLGDRSANGASLRMRCPLGDGRVVPDCLLNLGLGTLPIPDTLEGRR